MTSPTPDAVAALEQAGVPGPIGVLDGDLRDALKKRFRRTIVRDLPSIVRATVPLWEEELLDEVGEAWLRKRLAKLDQNGAVPIFVRNSSAFGGVTPVTVNVPTDRLLAALSPSTTEPSNG